MDPHLIYDVGMHQGEDAEFYLRKGFRVVGVEADPALCEITRRRLTDFVASGQLTIVNAAIGPTAGPMPFFLNANPLWNTAVQSLAQGHVTLHQSPSQVVTVDAVTFDTILERYGIPYYLKVDIEGLDLLCLEALRGKTSTPKYVSVEGENMSFDHVFDTIALMRELGYRGFKIVQQETVEHVKPPYPSREGTYVDYRFPSSASGLFGDELPGKWLDTEGAMREFVKLYPRFRALGHGRIRSRILRGLLHRLGLSPGWHDIHARRD